MSGRESLPSPWTFRRFEWVVAALLVAAIVGILFLFVGDITTSLQRVLHALFGP